MQEEWLRGEGKRKTRHPAHVGGNERRRRRSERRKESGTGGVDRTEYAGKGDDPWISATDGRDYTNGSGRSGR